jgi:hypothetical protein
MLDAAMQIGPRPPEPGGTDLGNGVRLGPEHRVQDTDQVTNHVHRIYRAEAEIGGVDYQSCAACRCVLLGEIGFVDDEQGKGNGSRVPHVPY